MVVKMMKELKINFDENEIAKLKEIFKTDDENQAVKMAINEILKKDIYDNILALKGNVTWEGNLEEMRTQRI